MVGTWFSSTQSARKHFVQWNPVSMTRILVCVHRAPGAAYRDPSSVAGATCTGSGVIANGMAESSSDEHTGGFVCFIQAARRRACVGAAGCRPRPRGGTAVPMARRRGRCGSRHNRPHRCPRPSVNARGAPEGTALARSAHACEVQAGQTPDMRCRREERARLARAAAA